MDEIKEMVLMLASLQGKLMSSMEEDGNNDILDMTAKFDWPHVRDTLDKFFEEHE